MADQANDQKQDTGWLDKVKNFLMAHNALSEASGQPLPHPANWMPEDTTGVAKAAKEAGDRMQADKARQAAMDAANRVKGPR